MLSAWAVGQPGQAAAVEARSFGLVGPFAARGVLRPVELAGAVPAQIVIGFASRRAAELLRSPICADVRVGMRTSGAIQICRSGVVDSCRNLG